MKNDTDISLNFGAIKESILRLSSRNFINEGTNNVSDFAQYIKSNDVLKKQHLAFKSLADTNKKFNKERLAERFLNQTLNIFEGVSWQDLINENRKLRYDFLNETKVGSTTDRDELFNSIHTLMEAKCRKDFDDIEKEQEAYEYVINHLMSEKENNEQEQKNINESEETDHPPLGSWEYVTKLAVSNFNKRYEHLSESEKNLLNILLSPYDKKKNYLKDLQEESTNNLNKILEKENDNENNQVLKEFKEKVGKIDGDNIEPQNIDEAIIYCFDLNEDIKNN